VYKLRVPVPDDDFSYTKFLDCYHSSLH
jgi:hypothetical protein